MKNLIIKFALGACVAATIGAALFSDTRSAAQVKITAPVAAMTPKNIVLDSVEIEIAALGKKIEKLEKTNQDLQGQINDLKHHVEFVDPKQGLILTEPLSIQAQINDLTKKNNDLSQKLTNHQHRVSLSGVNLPSLGCDKCAFQPLVVTYSKSSETTSAAIFK